tara:strand:+ start:1796 stop:2845 length:1050 start_codon:yes stop_codon:yes gene_type:complete
MDGVIKNEINGKLYIKRLFVPSHRNKFYLQIFSHIIYSLQVIYFFVKERKSIDVVFATSSRLGTGFLGYIISSLFKKKYALDIRDIFSDSIKSLNISNLFFGKIIVKILEFLEKKITTRSNWLNFVSPGFLNYHHINPQEKKINIFFNGIDSIFIKNRNEKNKIVKNKSKKLVITYAGNIGYGQGLENTIPKIAYNFKDEIDFKLIGDGNSVDLIKSEIVKKNLSNVKILRPVNRNVLIQHYNYSDALYLQLNNHPAFKNVLPSKIFDYGSFDKPILAGVSGVSKKFIEENISHPFIFDSNDYKSAIKQIENILTFNYSKIDNNNFITKYNRKKIMQLMTNSIYDNLQE